MFEASCKLVEYNCQLHLFALLKCYVSILKQSVLHLVYFRTSRQTSLSHLLAYIFFSTRSSLALFALISLSWATSFNCSSRPYSFRLFSARWRSSDALVSIVRRCILDLALDFAVSSKTRSSSKSYLRDHVSRCYGNYVHMASSRVQQKLKILMPSNIKLLTIIYLQ